MGNYQLQVSFIVGSYQIKRVIDCEICYQITSSQIYPCMINKSQIKAIAFSVKLFLLKNLFDGITIFFSFDWHGTMFEKMQRQ